MTLTILFYGLKADSWFLICFCCFFSFSNLRPCTRWLLCSCFDVCCRCGCGSHDCLGLKDKDCKGRGNRKITRKAGSHALVRLRSAASRSPVLFYDEREHNGTLSTSIRWPWKWFSLVWTFCSTICEVKCACYLWQMVVHNIARRLSSSWCKQCAKQIVNMQKWPVFNGYPINGAVVFLFL